MSKEFASALLALAILTGAAGARADTLKAEPGQWKTTVVSQGGSSPGTPRTTAHCITQKDIDEFGDKMAAAQQARTPADVKCQRTVFNQTSSAVDWKFECSGKITMVSEGSIKFDSPTHYTGTIKMNGSANGAPITNSLTMEGTRLGACTDAPGAAH